MKKYLTILLIFLLSLTACGKAEPPVVKLPEVTEPVQTEGTAQAEVQEPEAEGEVKVNEENGKIQLTMAGLHIRMGIMRPIVTAFNEQSRDYEIVLVDYAEDGVTDDQAKQRLYTEILAGNGPDLLCFENLPGAGLPQLSPLDFVSKGLLADMTDLLESDPDVSREDILIWDALTSCGGLYFLSPFFEVDTMMGSAEVFGDRSGWTIQDYLDMEAALAPDQIMCYKMDPALFVEAVAGRYARTTLDYQNAICDFDNPEFTAILEAAAQVGVSNVEDDPSAGEPAYAWKLKRDGKLMVSGSWVNALSTPGFDLRYMEQMPCYIGYPTPDGSCGSDVNLTASAGICAQSDCPEGAWAFMKFLLTQPQFESDLCSLPVYLPKFMELWKDHSSNAGDASASQEILDILLNLARQCRSTTFYDESIQQILLEETAPFLEGTVTAEQAAKTIQDRASLYMAEQYG